MRCIQDASLNLNARGPSLFGLALLDPRLVRGMNHHGRLDRLCPRLRCSSNRLLRRNGFPFEIPHCHIFSDVIDVAPDPKPLRRGPGSFLLPLRWKSRVLRLRPAVRRHQLCGCGRRAAMHVANPAGHDQHGKHCCHFPPTLMQVKALGALRDHCHCPGQPPEQRQFTGSTSAASGVSAGRGCSFVRSAARTCFRANWAAWDIASAISPAIN